MGHRSRDMVCLDRSNESSNISVVDLSPSSSLRKFDFDIGLFLGPFDVDVEKQVQSFSADYTRLEMELLGADLRTCQVQLHVEHGKYHSNQTCCFLPASLMTGSCLISKNYPLHR